MTLDATKDSHPEVNVEKNKFMFMSQHQNLG
jgi:hypothetical protein